MSTGLTVPFTVIIPARLASTRLPGKMLLDVGGKPLLQHAYEAALGSKAAKVIIATDNRKIADTAKEFNAECIMTSAEHVSGTERIAETVNILGYPENAIIVNVQGDEIGMPSELINQVAELLAAETDRQMATLCELITSQAEINNPNVVKVVFGENKQALYFSRSPIPWHKDGTPCKYYRHIGIYAYRAGFLEQYSKLPKCDIEQAESLEQLRALYHGINILVDIARFKPGIGIDTESDLQRAREMFG